MASVLTIQDGEGDGVVDYQSPRGRGRSRPFFQNRRYFGPPRGRGAAGRNYFEVRIFFFHSFSEIM